MLTAPAVVKRANALGVDMPICQTVNAVLFENMPIKEAMNDLLSRPFKDEWFQL
ncbi:MAG: hypothetical protein ACI4RJ_04835 [Alphaproteobacteria bacterium]